MPAVIDLPTPELDDSISVERDDWVVIVLDNPINTFDQVIRILQLATGCSLEEAEMETWEVHHLGRSFVHHGSVEECRRAAAIIRRIGIQVQVERV